MPRIPPVARTQIERFPEVTALIISDDTGAILAWSGEVDAEAHGAVHAVTAQALARCGSALGLGALQHVRFLAPRTACVITMCEDEILGVYIDPSKPVAAFERKLDLVLRR